ncbi:hypothetical protein RE123_001290 [Klebsiella pneumoniae]|nr:hypothetical protein [Klebsiella pneumoniae]EKZ6601071.1 hypothetical protein [Klebsiella pneumoniae]ELA0552645.1 hypothetical protein [Klebsiella pneumoniae]ELA2267729.1 hypothetical protein [Klebsiella pneumoniae]EMD6267886.1 hypothetical protein [Klebsiella pneumoniae]
MKKLPGSLEIKLHERLSKNDILNVLAEQMTILEETFDIQEFKSFSFLECYIDGKKQALYINDSNGIVSSFTSNTQHNIENTSKTVIKDGGKRIVSYDKSFDADKIAKTIHEIQAFNTYKYSFNNVTVMPASIINSIIQQEENKRREEEDKLYLIRQLKREQEEAQRRKEREEYERPLKSLIARKIMESGLTDLEFKRTICSSFDYIKSRSVIAKYLANKPDLLEKYHDSRIIRMSIKNDEGKVGKVELYDLSGTLIFESYKNK